MQLQKGSMVFVAVALIVIGTAYATSVYTNPGGSLTTSNPVSTSASSKDGLKLTLQISGSEVQQGGSVTINVTEANTNAMPLNESAAHGWAVQGLRMSVCYSSVYPFGIAVYAGHYTSADVSSAKPLNLYPLVPCPLLLRYISGYYFQANSNVAMVLPGTGPGLPMASGLVASGNFTTGTTRAAFTPGDYTVVAGDEWGALVFLYFTVH